MFKRLANFFQGCKSEFNRLNWPTREQAIRLTGIVLIFCGIMTVFFFTIDYGLSNILVYFIR